jgi:hypothetical protein
METAPIARWSPARDTDRGIVTGSTAGIRRGAAEGLARADASVVISRALSSTSAV